MSGMVTYSRHDGRSLSPLVPALVNLYAVVYAEPPYQEGLEQVDRFRETISGEGAYPGFTLIAAHDEEQLVGAAYGWTMLAGKWWSRAAEDGPAEVRDAEKLAVMEWMVHPQRRAEGIGAELMRQLLQGRQEPWATLASDPRSLARSMYKRAGWRQVGQSRLPWGPAMDLLVLEAPGR